MNLTQQLNCIRIDQASVNILSLMRTAPNANKYQIELHTLLGNFKSTVVGCGCVRPTSCGLCRTKVEDEIYWSEKMDDLLDEARREDQDNRESNHE